jgi:SAM-dependent methyltransferase
MVTIPDVSDEPLSPCPACGAQNWKNAGQVKDYSITGEWFELKECCECHLKRTFPQPQERQIGRYCVSKDYISHSDTRSGLTNKLYHQAREHMLKKKHHLVSRVSGLDKGVLLDVGAGTGHFAHYMQTHGWQVLALEPDENARKVAAEKLGIEIRPLEALAVQQPLSYDVITLWHVLEHVHDVQGYMDHFRSILKPGGTLIIAVPNHTSRDAKQYGQNWAAYDVPRHLWHFSPASMEKLMLNHRFSLLQKIPMPLDAFYVSMLSEKYNGNDFFAPMAAMVSGIRTFFDSKADVNRASSIIYVAR